MNLKILKNRGYIEEKNKMIHILEFESYGGLNEAKTIPVYNENDYMRSPSADPEMSVPQEDIVEIIGVLLGSQKHGKIKNLVVDATLPKQGKNSPEYLKSVISDERERMAKRKYFIHGSRIEKDDRPEDDYTDAINIFVDTEFLVISVGENEGKECVFAIPRSLYGKAQRDPSLSQSYTICLFPEQIEEVSYTPID